MHIIQVKALCLTLLLIINALATARADVQAARNPSTTVIKELRAAIYSLRRGLQSENHTLASHAAKRLEMLWNQAPQSLKADIERAHPGTQIAVAELISIGINQTTSSYHSQRTDPITVCEPLAKPLPTKNKKWGDALGRCAAHLAQSLKLCRTLQTGKTPLPAPTYRDNLDLLGK